MTDKQLLPGDIAVVIGSHERQGEVILIQAGGIHLALADDISDIVGRNDPIEGDA